MPEEFSLYRMKTVGEVVDMMMPKEKRDKGNNTATEGVLYTGLGRKKGPWIMCALVLLIVTVILNVDFERNDETPQSRANMFAHYSLKLPSYSSMTTVTSHSDRHPPHKHWHNLFFEESSNYTSTLMSLLHLNATSDSPCFRASTKYIKLEGLPQLFAGKYFFATDVLHRLTVVAYEENGERRCAGGDYLEVDFHNNHYRSRLPTVDFGNGSYGLDLIVPSRFAGSFVLDISVLYGNFHGLELLPNEWVRLEVILTEELEMIAEWKGELKIDIPHVSTPPLKQCTPSDFSDRTAWEGRWTRSQFSETCEADWEKRFRCLSEEQFQCEEPWCFGPVGRLESNGWVYSAHCSFKIFERDEAWKCLDGRWFLMWGDSNFLDTIRNLMLFILDWNLPRGQWLSGFTLPRNYERSFINPNSLDQTFRVSQVWNAAINEQDIGEGLDTLIKHKEHQERVLSYFNQSKTKWPDTIIMNSGMHDGIHNYDTATYIESADWALDWWIKLYTSIPLERRPKLLWRTTIAPAGLVRPMPSNPNKLEMYNHVMMEKLKGVSDVLPVKFVDTFDLTFPFHYNNNYSDGGHYGRPPGSNEAPWYEEPHWYFVDIMLAHILLNALCPAT